MPTRKLPSRPNLDHLRHQAKDLLRDQRAGRLDACQRIREFNPRFAGATDAEIGAGSFTLSDAQLAVAREYGFASWARLRTFSGRADRPGPDVPVHERIENAAFRRADEARRRLPDADGASRHRALALAAQHGHAGIVGLLLEAGEDPDRYNPVGCHAHSTPLHQAALAGHAAVVRMLVERGARLDIEDIHHRGTRLGWAEHGGRTEIAAYLRGLRQD